MAALTTIHSPVNGTSQKTNNHPHSHPDTREITPPTTPTALSSSANQLLLELQNIHSTLLTIPSLSPGPQINMLLTHLVDLCIQPRSSEFSAYFFDMKGVEELCGGLRGLCARAEGLLEAHWAERFLNSSSPSPSSSQQSASKSPSEAKHLLHTFLYYQNYIDLSRLECSILEAFLPTPQNMMQNTTTPQTILFIGSGPLPLSSFCMLERWPKAVVWNIDRDCSALEISRELSKRFGYEGMRFSCEDVAVENSEQRGVEEIEIGSGSGSGSGSGMEKISGMQWKSFDVVFLAALVGMDSSEKIEILAALAGRLAKGTLVVARSARGLRKVLYPDLELGDELQDIGYEILAEVHPWTKVINSVVVLRVK